MLKNSDVQVKILIDEMLFLTSKMLFFNQGFKNLDVSLKKRDSRIKKLDISFKNLDNRLKKSIY